MKMSESSRARKAKILNNLEKLQGAGVGQGPDMVAYVCSPGPWELEVGGLGIQGYLQLTAFTT